MKHTSFSRALRAFQHRPRKNWHISCALVTVVCLLTFLGLLPSTVPSCHAEDISGAGKKISIVRISPEGLDVPKPTQIVIQFDGPVVPLGRMTRSSQEVLVTISPSLACHWTWINTSALACNLDEKNLPLNATTYSVTVPAKFDVTSNLSLAGPVSHSFMTQRPTVANSWFSTWKTPGSPQIQFSTNQAVSADSLARSLSFNDRFENRIAAQVVEAPRGEDQESEGLAANPPETRWIASPSTELSVDSTYRLTISPGLVSKEGTELGIENRTISEFHTFPAPRFLGINCMDTDDKPLWIPQGDSAKKSQYVKNSIHRCDPLRTVQLVFNSPVLKDQIRNALRSAPDLRGGRTDFDPWEDVYSYSRLSGSRIKDQQYPVSLPYGLKAFASYALSADGTNIRDEFGRPLINSIDITFHTNHRRPRYVLDNSFSVLEKDTDSKLPVVVNNLDSLSLTYQAVTTSSNREGKVQTLTPYNVQDIAYHYPIDIRGILAGRSGAVQGTLATKPQTSDGSRWFFSQVTPFAVHFKLGHFNSLAWVTSLKTGEPIIGAKVSVTIDTLSKLSASARELVAGITDERGVVLLSGSEAFDPKLELLNEWENTKKRLVVRVQKDDDMALVPLSWDLQVYSDTVYPSTQEQYGHIHTWGTTAQGLYKAGDSVQFSLWVRNQNTDTLTQAPREGYSLKVFDPMDTVVFEVPQITLSEFGGFSGAFTTKQTAAVGWYRFVLSSKFSQLQWHPLRVLISDFTPAPFKLSTELNAERFRAGDELRVTTQARLHAGGPYAEAMSRVTARIKGTPINIPNPTLAAFLFESDLDKDLEVFQKEELLDRNGDRVSSVTLVDSEVAFGSVLVESAVSDDRGKSVSTTARRPFIGRDRYVGLAQADWLLTAKREASVQVVVVDDSFKVVPGNQVTTEWFYEETKAARVKTAGNVYTTKYEQEFVSLHKCSLTSELDAVLCTYTPQKPGRYKITATVKDTKGRTHQTSIYRWASGAGDVVWASGTSDELPIIPEKKTYKVGETARFFIRNPFPGSTALLTTERYGIQKNWTEMWRDSSVIVEVPITRNHIPGFYLSATITSPRVDKPIENQVDLGKPSFKLGYAAIDVVDAAKELKVEVKSRSGTYKPKETVHIDVAARIQQGTPPPVQYAVTVLDEAVFDLLSEGRSYFDPYKGFYQLDGLDVRNYNLIKILLGRQKFEKKGASPGGDGGGNLDFRSLRKFVSYWNPAIAADEQGRASFSFEAPDNLTGWKVFVIALTKDDLMGLGEGTFVVNKEIELRSALPNLVREGDTCNAVFTVMNRSDKLRTLTVEAQVESGATAQPVRTTITAEPFKRYPVALKLSDTKSESVRCIARAFDETSSDALSVQILVMPRGTLTTAATFGSSNGEKIEESVAVPSDIVLGAGSVGAVLSPSVIGGLQGSFEYMKAYPYSCWEQRISKALSAMYASALRDYLPKSFSWDNAEELITATLRDLPSFQAPNGGMSFFIPQDEYVDAYLSAYTALALNRLRDAGYSVPTTSEEKLHTYLSSLLKNDSFQDFFSQEMKWSVRALILAVQAQQKLITVNDLLRFEQSVATMDLFGKAHYLEAVVALKAPHELQKRVLTMILSHTNETGAGITFSDTATMDAAARILGSGTRTECAVLAALVTTAKDAAPSLQQGVNTIIPKLTRSISSARKRLDHWKNTQENVVCVGALAHFSRAYEATSTVPSVSVQVGSEKLGSITFGSKAADSQEISRPLASGDAGKSQTLTLSPSGNGRFYYSARLSYMPGASAEQPHNAGMEVFREYSIKRGNVWTLVNNPVSLQQGELVKVDIFVKIPTARNFVVVNDPLPGGLETVNRDLATSSDIDARAQASGFAPNSMWWTEQNWTSFGSYPVGFYHKEMRHYATRFYSEHLPAGRYHLSYVAQAIAVGTFKVPPLTSEEMYNPDVYGRTGSDTLRVETAAHQ